MIKLKNVIKEYRNETVVTMAVDDVNFDIAEGEFVAIIGASGSGKSTLTHIMAFLDRPSSGVYQFRDNSINDLSDDQLARIRNKEMGFVFQSFALLPRTTIFENVKLPLIYTGLSQKKINKMTKQAIESTGLSHRSNYFTNQLSGGEQQRTAIARAIVNNPSVIFADEPTGNLDSKSGQQILEILQKLNDKGHTIILVTHEKYTSEMAKRIIEMKDGKIIRDEKITNRKYAKKGLIK
ncbi:MAG: ABC transporter ATP-binding protein [Patescibacteria group bacterium]|nr:ABC transporter ATP-binding protein [Patescibacteria group bacterium]